ncbi:MAG: shikimate dehydrogenase family protein [Acidimicrobiia bacterium]
MRFDELSAATEPTFYFIGVTTGSSSIVSVFPAWAAHLGISPIIKGVDCRLHDEAGVYRAIVDFLKEDELSLGALVTTHKLDLFEAAGPSFDWLDDYAGRLREISCISKRDVSLRGHAKDPISSGLAFDAIADAGHQAGQGREVCVLGAGGSALALTIHLMTLDDSRRPTRVYVTNRSRQRLEDMRAVHRSMDLPTPIEYRLCRDAKDNDAVVGELSDGAIVINATGLGKDAPGSPLSDDARFPDGAIVWDFNYRGDLHFLEQAAVQQERRTLTLHDGWVYFVHGWLSVIGEVFDLDIPSSGTGFETLCDIAAEARR